MRFSLWQAGERINLTHKSKFQKFLKKSCSNKFSDYFTKNDLLSNCQHGFCPNHSTETSAIEFIDHLKLEIDKGHVPISIFIDLSKAFDTVDHGILIEKLKHGFVGIELNWFMSYLNDRQQYVSYDGALSYIVNKSESVSQGSILKPSLFLSYMNVLNSSSSFFKCRFSLNDSARV